MKRKVFNTIIKTEDVKVTEYHCMVTCRNLPLYDIWLTTDDMVDMIKRGNSFDYYRLGEERERVIGQRQYHEVITIYEDVTEEQIIAEMMEDDLADLLVF